MNGQTCLSQESTWNMQRVGRPKVITDEYVSNLKDLVSHGPQKYGYPFKRWTASWLRIHLAKELGIEVSDRHINRLLSQMGLSTRTGEPSAVHSDQNNAQNNDGQYLSRPISQILIQDLNPLAVPEFKWPFLERRGA